MGVSTTIGCALVIIVIVSVPAITVGTIAIVFLVKYLRKNRLAQYIDKKEDIELDKKDTGQGINESNQDVDNEFAIQNQNDA